MNIPTFSNQQAVNKAGHSDEGYFTANMQLFFDLFFNQMQINFSNDGIVFPPLTTAEIQAIVDPTDNENAKGPGTMWYDTTINKYVGNENGTLVVFSTTPL